MQKIKKIGIIGAMEVEVARLKQDMTDVTVREKAGMYFYSGRLMGMRAVVVKSGVGKVNAAVCTQILADDFEVDAVINTGVAGSLDNAINIGDIVVSTDVLHHDMDASVFGYRKGQVPQMEVYSFRADESLARAAVSVCGEVNPEIRAHRGRIVSGDQFVENESRKEELRSLFFASCTEMEGAAIAHTAWLNRIPFVIIRAISDKADGSDIMDYPVFEEMAAKHSLRLVEGMLKNMNDQ